MTLLRCPGCGGEMSIDVLLSHNALRQAIVDLVEKGLSLGSLVMRYVGLFRPATNRMSPDRFCKLIQQLLPDLERRAITFKGRDWAIPPQVWQQGLEAMLEKAAGDKLTLPLDNHNYLYSVLVALADKVEAAQEQQVEEQRRTPTREVEGVRPGNTPVYGDEPIGRSTTVADLATRALGVPEHIRAEIEAVRSGKPLAEVRGGATDA